MSIHEIVLPETKPETEWILGRAVRKVSPFRTHALLQSTVSSALKAWAKRRGDVGTEWRFRPAPAGEIRRPLVPDVSYVSDARLAGLDGHDLEAPPFSPDVAVEILSPGDRARDLEHKIAVYLATGTALVIVIDPRDRSVRLHDARGVRVLLGDDVIAHGALPGFSLTLPALFEELDRRR
ncbi:MAG: Uma2 family endonuclease [Candidatus Eremiobacteraeota bacterium]|nr:Uma2 family endonuclease [Candidatus Eremiobacteraeota bacterium]